MTNDPHAVDREPEIGGDEETLSRVIDLLEADEGTEPWLRQDMLNNAKRRLPLGVGGPDR